MAVAVSGTAHAASATGSVTSLATPSHTVAAGDDLIGFGGSSATTPDNTASYVWDAAGVNESLTEVDDLKADFFHCSSHYLIGPTAKTAVGTLTLVAADSEVEVAIVNVTGLDPTTPILDNATNNATTGAAASVTVTGGASGDLCLGAVSKWRQFLSTSDTEVVKVEDIAPGVSLGVASAPGGTSVTLDWTGTGTGSNNYVACGLMLKAAAAGAEIAGSVTVTASIAADMEVGRTIAGAVTAAVTPAADMEIGRTIAGDVPVAVTPGADLEIGRVLAGSVPVAVTPAAGLEIGRSIAGAVPVTVTPAAGLVFEGGAQIDGAVTITVQVLAEMIEGRALAGAVTVTVTPAADLVVGFTVSAAEVTVVFGRERIGRRFLAEQVTADFVREVIVDSEFPPGNSGA